MTWNAGAHEDNFAYLQGQHISTTHEETFHDCCLDDLADITRSRKIEEKDKEKHARLPAQVPASRVSKKNGQVKKTRIKKQVTSWNIAKQRQKGDHPQWRELQCGIEQRKSCISYRLANFSTLPTTNAGVTRTRWHRQHAIVVATKKVHQRGKNGKGRDCDAEQFVKTWWQECHTGT